MSKQIAKTRKKKPATKKPATKKPHPQCDIDTACAICDANAQAFCKAIDVVQDMLDKAETELTGFKELFGEDLGTICMEFSKYGDELLEAVGLQSAACALSHSLDETGNVDQAILLAYDRIQEFNDDVDGLKELKAEGAVVWPAIEQAAADAYADFIKKLPAKWHHNHREERGVR